MVFNYLVNLGFSKAPHSIHVYSKKHLCSYYFRQSYFDTNGRPLLRQRCLSLSINVNYAFDDRTFN